MNERNRSKISPITPLVDFAWFLIKWGLVVTLISGVLGVIYLYNRVDEDIRVLVQKALAQHYKGLTISVRSARLLEREGLEIRGVSISGQLAKQTRSEIAYLDEIHVRCHPTLQGLLSQKLDVRHVTVRRVTLRGTRLPDGTWDVAHLLPLPRLGSHPPPATIENATIEIIDPVPQPSRTLTLRSVSLELVPEPAAKNVSQTAARLFRVKGTVGGDHVERADIEGLIDLDHGHWSLEGRLTGLAINPELRNSLPASYAERLRALGSLRSRGTFDFQVKRGPEGPVQFHFAGEVSGGRADDPRLTYPLTDLTAQVHCDNQSVRIEDLTARYGPATLAGTYRGTIDRPVEVSGQVRKLHIDRKLVDVLPEQLRAEWFRFQPTGSIDADFRFQFDGQRWRPDVSVTCLDLSAMYDRFPYPLHKGSGTVSLKNGLLEFSDFRILAGDAPIRVQGTIQRPGPDWTGKLELQTTGRIPLDRRLIDAQKESARRIIQDFHPQGWITFRASLQRDQGPVRHRLVVNLHDCSVRHLKFLYPLYDVHGQLTMVDGRWSFRDLEGHNGAARVRCHGDWLPGGDGGGLRLNFEAAPVPLEDELRDALSGRGKNLWMALRPRGTLDHLEASLKYSSPNRQPVLDIRLKQHRPTAARSQEGISIHPVWFPYKIDELTGTVQIQDGNVTLTQIRAVHDEVSLAAEGIAHFEPGGNWTLRFDRLLVDELELYQEDFLRALPPRLRRGVSQLALSGPLNVDGSVELSGSSRLGAPLAYRWDVILSIVGGRLNHAITMDHIAGQVHLIGNGEGNEFHGRGTLAIDSMLAGNVQFSHLHGPLWMDQSRLRLGSWAQPAGAGQSPQPMRAALFGGTLTSSAQFVFGQAGPFELNADLNDADLAAVVRETSRRPPPIQGRAFGVLELGGNRHGTHALRGRGQIGLRDADIYTLPVIVALLKILRAESPDRTAFTTSDIGFRIEGDHVYFDRIDMSGDAISLKGKGDMDLQQQINLDFYTLLGRERDYLPAVLPFLGEASRRLLMIHVSGTLDQPQTTQQVLPELNETLQEWFPELTKQPNGNSDEASRLRLGRRWSPRLGRRQP